MEDPHLGQQERGDRLALAAQVLDGRLAFDAGDPAARVARLYEAALDRLPDQGGLNFWIDSIRDGEPLSSLASGFLSAPEFTARFGDIADNGAFVDRLYLNVLGRAGEAEGRAFWMAMLDNGAGLDITFDLYGYLRPQPATAGGGSDAR